MYGNIPCVHIQNGSGGGCVCFEADMKRKEIACALPPRAIRRPPASPKALGSNKQSDAE